VLQLIWVEEPRHVLLSLLHGVSGKLHRGYEVFGLLDIVVHLLCEVLGFARLEDHWEVVAVPVIGPVLHSKNDRVQIVHGEITLTKATMAIWHIEKLLHTFKNEKTVRVPITQ
jgi:hypothetical protein